MTGFNNKTFDKNLAFDVYKLAINQMDLDVLTRNLKEILCNDIITFVVSKVLFSYLLKIK